ncbi:MAG TPA: L,D-transpeptidase [Jatrophihabitantaceae bacterium]|jgi:lipoprotein-anchoring transpeptidase ErfK/SrfK
MTTHRAKRRRVLLRWLPTVLVLVAVIAGGIALSRFHGPRPRLAAPTTTSVSPAAQIHAPVQPPSTPPPATPTPSRRPATPKAVPSPCRTSADAQHVIVSVSKQHAWICAGTRQVKDSAVTTGATATDDGTPLGTWHVQAKETDRTLTVLSGESFQVKYWMPYDGVYGFHDSSWQTFPYGSQQYRTAGSHGCVHFPLAVMSWIYNWAQVGATVTIQS